MRRFLPLAASLLAAGCDGPAEWMPLETGRSWTYRVRTPHYQYVERLTVGERAPVGDVQGHELESALGDARLAWRGSTLTASFIGHSHFSPPVPLFDADGGTKPIRWRGIAMVAGKTWTADADLAHSDDEVRSPGGNRRARKAVLTLRAGPHTVEWTGWFVRGDGLVRQEQRSNGLLEASLEMIRGS